MKTIIKALTLSAVLGFACLPAADATSIGACRYFCDGAIRETYLSNCCSRTVTCPSGQTTTPFAVYTARGWQFCGPTL